MFLQMFAAFGQEADVRLIDPRVESFVRDGGKKMELIDGMAKAEAIAQLRAIRGRHEEVYTHSNSEAMKADEALLRMGDEDTIRRIMDQYHKGEGAAETLLMAADQTALKYLVEDVRNGPEEWRRVASDAWAAPIRYTSAMRFMFIVEHGEGFPSETRAWADKMQTLLGIGSQEKQAAKILLTWWDKNEKAINEGRYADATWLPVSAGKSSPEDQRKPLRQGDDERQSKWDVGIADDGLLSEKGQDAARNMNSGAKLALYLVGVAILIFIIWIFLKAKTRRKMGNNP